MRKIIIICILILVGIYFSCTKQKHIFRSEPITEYYPLRVGNFWVYRDNSILYEYYIKKEVVDFCLIQGGIGVYKVRYFCTYVYYPDTVKYAEEWFTYQTIIDNEVREFSDLNNPDEYEIILRFPLEMGSSWREPQRQTDSVWTFSILIDSVIAVENVITPAGQFEGCYRIKKIPGPGSMVIPFFESWFKPQIGFVKFRRGLGMIEYSLIDYKIIK